MSAPAVPGVGQRVRIVDPGGRSLMDRAYLGRIGEVTALVHGPWPIRVTFEHGESRTFVAAECEVVAESGGAS